MSKIPIYCSREEKKQSMLVFLESSGGSQLTWVAPTKSLVPETYNQNWNTIKHACINVVEVFDGKLIKPWLSLSQK